MGDFAANLPSHFGLVGVRAVKERGTYLISSRNAKIHKSNKSPQEIHSIYNLLNSIKNKFEFAENIIPATSGAPFVSLGRDIFVMTRHVLGNEPDICNFSDMLLLIKNLAGFHVAAKNWPNVKIPEAQPLGSVFTKQSTALNSAVKLINRRPRLSDMDVLLLKHADDYSERAKNAAKILEETDYAALYANAIENKHVCHNNLKEESFTISGENCYISSFDEIKFDLQLVDLASVLGRYARKSSREIPITEFLEAYNEISPLPPSAEKILYAYLSFPWSFLKIVSDFYSKKHNFIPASVTSKMTGVLDAQKDFDAYIGQLIDD